MRLINTARVGSALASLAALIVLSTAATPAAATIMQTTITGVIFGGATQTTILGPPRDLNGHDFSVVIKLDDSIAHFESSDGNTHTFMDGGNLNLPNAITADLTVDGYTDHMLGLTYGRALFIDDPSEILFEIDHEGCCYFFNDLTLVVTAPVLGPGYDWTTPLSDTCCGSIGSGHFRHDREPNGYHDDANLDIRSISIVNLSTAPEPESWTLMIAGFAAAGALLRRRRAAGSRRVQSLR